MASERRRDSDAADGDSADSDSADSDYQYAFSEYADSDSADADALAVPRAKLRESRFVREARTLAASMYEAKDMAVHVVERLEGALQLVAASPLREASLVGTRIGAIAKEFCDFLDRFGGKKTVFRLVCNREVVSQIQDFHKNIDKALNGLGVDVGGESAWRQRWEGYREAHEMTLSNFSEKEEDYEFDASEDLEGKQYDGTPPVSDDQTLVEGEPNRPRDTKVRNSGAVDERADGKDTVESVHSHKPADSELAMTPENRGDGDSAVDDALVAPRAELRAAECRRFNNYSKTLAHDMFETKDMALHVVERLETLVNKVESSQDPHAAVSVGTRLEAVAKEFRIFLSKFRGKKTVFRLVNNRVVVNRIQYFHKDIDNLLDGLGAAEDALEWRPRWEGYREAQLAAFEKISKYR
ncbi:hypothetical protein PybrP1_006388, partial [[Pythium] brassicae (nom. inval.)]